MARCNGIVLEMEKERVLVVSKVEFWSLDDCEGSEACEER